MDYNESQDESMISTIESQVTGVKNIMMQNIDTILGREEKSNNILDKTDDPQTTVSVPICVMSKP
jgi:hypothetical protein